MLTSEGHIIAQQLAREDWILFQVFMRHAFGERPFSRRAFEKESGIGRNKIAAAEKLLLMRNLIEKSGTVVARLWHESGTAFFGSPVESEVYNEKSGTAVAREWHERGTTPPNSTRTQPVDGGGLHPKRLPIRIDEPADRNTSLVTSKEHQGSSSLVTSNTSTSTRRDATRFDPLASKVISLYQEHIKPGGNRQAALEHIDWLIGEGWTEERFRDVIRGYKASFQGGDFTYAKLVQNFFHPDQQNFGGFESRGKALREKTAPQLPPEMQEVARLMADRTRRGNA